MKYILITINLFCFVIISLQGCSGSTLILPLTDVQQETSYTCGASAAKSILLYYGIECTEEQIAKEFGTTESSGTSPEQLVIGFKKHGLEALIKENATLEDIYYNLGNNFPTLVAVQAWLENYPPKHWETTWEDGHWLIVLGMDDQNIYFEDPSLFGSRGYMSSEEFLNRWHDYTGEVPCCDASDKQYNHLIITVKGNQVKPYIHID